MSTLSALGEGASEDEGWLSALALPWRRFLEDAPLSVRAAGALDRVAGHLGATHVGEICTAAADVLLKRLGGRRAWREVVDALADWLEDQADGVATDLDDDRGQASLFEPARRAPAEPPPLPPPGDPKAVVAWAERLDVADLLTQPMNRALASTNRAMLRTLPDASLLDVLAAKPGKRALAWSPRQGLRTGDVSPILRQIAWHYLSAIGENRRMLAEREAAHPRVSTAAAVEPVAQFRRALAAARETLGRTGARVRGSYVPELTFADDPARLTYRESPAGTAFGSFMQETPAKVEIRLGGWSAGGPVIDCACALPADECSHRAAALAAALDLLERPSMPGHRRLKSYLETPPWRRLLDRLETGMAAMAAAPSRDDERLAWIVRQRNDGTVMLAPLIRRRGARGWSKGAAVSLHDLGRQRSALAGPADARVIDIVTASAGHWGQAALAEPAQVFRALEALVGATNVFLNERRDTPASIRRVEPRVLVGAGPTPEEYGFSFALGEGRAFEPRAFLDLAGDRRHVLFLDEAANELRLALLPPELALLADALDRESAVLPAGAIDVVLSRLDRLQAVTPFELPPALVGETVDADPRIIFQLTPMGEGGLAVEIGARPLPEGRLHAPGEGAAIVFAIRDARRIAARRDLDGERRAAHALCESLALADEARIAPWRFALPDQEQALDLVVALREIGERVAVEWPAEPWRIEGARAGELRLRVTERRDWFGLEGGVEIDGQLVTLGALLEAARRRRRYIMLGPGRFARIEEDMRKRLGAADDSLLVSRGAVELGAAAPEIVAALVDDPARLEAIPSFHELRARRARAAAHTPVLPTGLRAELRPYQRQGFEWLSRLGEAGAGACLADDMGLGKTVQALAALLARAGRGPALVLAPTSVAPNWLAEAERFAPGLRRLLYRGAGRDRLLRDLGAGDLMVTSYAIATRDAEALAGIPFATLIVDEAQALKNAQARRTQAVRSLRADWRLALTGTPIENHLGELWSLFRVVSPALLGGWEHFRERFAAPIERHKDEGRRRALAELIRPFLLRRTKQEVAPELPAKTEVTRFVDLSPAERRLYDAARAAAIAALTNRGDEGGQSVPEGDGEGKRRFQILAALTRLRLLACHPQLGDETSSAPSSKVAALVELVSTLRETGHRTLVFSQFVGFLELVRDALASSGAKVLFLHGGTPAARRTSLVGEFQDGGADAFLISLKAGGTGLNLTGADTVVHLDPWWNPAVEDQATDRSHRIGQRRPVTVVRLVARGTVEEAVLALHADKRALARAVLDGADGGAALGNTELLALLEAGASDGAAWEETDRDDDVSGPSLAGPGEPGPEERGDGLDPQDLGALDLSSLDALIERAMAPLETNGSAPTAAQYRRALARFREFMASGRALAATSWSLAADQFLSALRDKSWPAPASFPSVARASLGHLLRAEQRGV